MANNIIERIWNQNAVGTIEDLSGSAFQAEAGAHTFVISGVDNAGATVALSGTVAGVFMKPDNTDVPLTGSISNGKASVTLTAECYTVPGRFGLTIFVTSGSVKTAVYAAVGNVSRTNTGNVSASAEADVVDLINRINAAVATVPASWSGLMADIAPTYSPSAVYPAGAYVYYNGDLYRSTTAITTAESWTPAHWTAAVLGDDVSSLKNAIEDVISLDNPVVIPFKIAGSSAYINHTTGDTTSNPANKYSYTDYIDISAYKTISYKRTGITTATTFAGMAFYKSDYSYDSGYKSGVSQQTEGYTSLTVEVPNGVKYARFTVYTNVDSYGAFSVSGLSKLFNFYDLAIKAMFPYLSSSGNANNITVPSVYLAVSAQNMPTASGTYLLITVGASTTSTDDSKWLAQFAIDDSANASMYKRFAYFNGTTWAYKNWAKVLDENTDILSLIANNAIQRTKLSNDYAVNYAYIPANGDCDNAITQGNYLVVAGATNTPIENATFTLDVNIHKTSANSDIWLTQFATTADGTVRTFVRKKYASGSFSNWAELTNNDKEFAGKKIVCFGDSITELGDYPSRLSNKTGATVYKCGFGGCRMSTYGNDPYSTMCMSYLSDYIATGTFTDLIAGAQSVYEQYGDDNRTQAQLVSEIDYSALDYMIIFFGTNDYGGNIPIGTDSDEGHDTFKGAVNLIIKNILSAYPNIHLMFVTPFWRATYTGTSAFCDSDIYTNPLGFKLPDYVDALIERANANHVPVLNLYDSMCIGKYNYTDWLADGLHPKSGKGYEYVAQKITAGFETFYKA